MTTKRLVFDFNTAITPIPEDGTFDEGRHKELIKPLRGQIMQIDGVTGCYIRRYDMQIDIVPGVTDADTVMAAIEKAVELAATHLGLFPLRGSKSPVAKLANRFNSFTFMVNSTFVPYTLSDDAKSTDTDARNKAMRPLVEELTSFDGIVTHELFTNGISITFDRGIIAPEELVEHVCETLRAATKKEGFFPYLNGRRLVIEVI